jgi:phosphatidylethanolamine/phosphatidyl-N-methylethanolamine N-methyltransferase
MGAVFPTSRRFSEFMAGTALAENADRIAQGMPLLELGSGTGSITHALLELGLPPEQLVSVELDPDLCTYLRSRFPGIRVVCADASQLSQVLAGMQTPFATAISAIPMTVLPKAVKQKMVSSVFDLMIPGGTLYQVTYRPASPLPSKMLGLQKRCVGLRLMNAPPALLWSYRRQVA